MNLTSCLHVMQISPENFTEYTILELKKQYHTLSREYHPDKGGSKDQFQQLNEAYTTLTKLKLETVEPTEIHIEDYKQYAQCIQFILTNKDFQAYISHRFMPLLKKWVYMFQNYYAEYITNFAIDKNGQGVMGKKVERINIRVTFEDMMENNIHKYNYEDTFFIIPMWHNEIYYEYKDREVIFTCVPDLPSNYYIDSYNTLHIIEYISIYDLIREKKHILQVGKKVLEIPMEKLFMKSFQSYVFKKEGLSAIDVNDMYNIKDKMDVVVHVNISFE